MITSAVPIAGSKFVLPNVIVLIVEVFPQMVYLEDVFEFSSEFFLKHNVDLTSCLNISFIHIDIYLSLCRLPQFSISMNVSLKIELIP